MAGEEADDEADDEADEEADEEADKRRGRDRWGVVDGASVAAQPAAGDPTLVGPRGAPVLGPSPSGGRPGAPRGPLSDGAMAPGRGPSSSRRPARRHEMPDTSRPTTDDRPRLFTAADDHLAPPR